MEKRWNILPEQKLETAQLIDSLKISAPLCTILAQRGFSNFDLAKNFFRPSLQALHSPWLMKDMEKAVSRIIAATTNKEKILVFGDYDVDGTTSVASFYQFLSSIYDKDFLDFYIPHRYKEGYGVSKIGIDFAAANNFTLIVCLDCGIKSVELIDYAKSLGIDFVICDHHLPGNILPDASAILNPKQSDCHYPFKDLCGCGIGFKLMMALTEELNLDESFYLRYLDLVAIAIAADIVSMSGENRILAYFGLEKINSNPSLGIKTLIKLGSLEKKLTIHNVVFVIAPRVNAAGRMDDAKKAVQLFIEQDEEKSLLLGEQLQSDNTDRKEADSSITEEALAIINESEELKNKKSTVLYREHWHKGVVGIVASRVIEHYYKPTIVLTKSDGIVTGSARSVKGFNLYEAIYECKSLLTVFGGHFAAAGLSMLPENVAAFTNKFEEVVSSIITDDLLTPEIVIDTVVELKELTESFYNILCQMEPFGPDNMRPVFMLKNVLDSGYSALLKDKHIKFSIRQGNCSLSGIAFNMSEKFHIVKSKQPFDIVFTLDENEWNGNKKLQMMVIDCRVSE